MTTNPDHFRPRETAGSQQYLDGAIRTASPARLRLMLIERAIDVSCILAERWRSKQTSSSAASAAAASAAAGPNEQSLKLLDLLSELLSGVTTGATKQETVVCKTVSDLYVFLIQHLVAAESASDASAVDEIRLVLEAEAETWRAVSAGEIKGGQWSPNRSHLGDSLANPLTAGLNIEA